METNEQICDLFKTVKNNIDTRTNLRIKEDNPALRDNNLGSQIAFYREKKKLTQKELAKILNVSRDWIVKIENTQLDKTKGQDEFWPRTGQNLLKALVLGQIELLKNPEERNV